MSLKNFKEAKKFGDYIVNSAKSINWIHEAILKSDLIFIAAVIDGDIETAKEIYEKEKKDLSKTATMISYQRTMYAYYSLCEVNEKKAADSKKSFETLTKHYPYKDDLRIEEEYMQMVEQRKNSIA